MKLVLSAYLSLVVMAASPADAMPPAPSAAVPGDATPSTRYVPIGATSNGREMVSFFIDQQTQLVVTCASFPTSTPKLSCWAAKIPTTPN